MRNNQVRLSTFCFAYLLPLVLVIALSLFITYNIYLQTTKTIFAGNEKKVVTSGVELVGDLFHGIISDLNFLADCNELQLFFKEAGPENLALLQREYLLFTEKKRIYDQIRFLDTSGNEIVRVNYNSCKPSVVSANNLQFKGKRYYFTDSLKLDKGEIFISPFDLNIEHGEVEQPLKPMIRMATPVFDQSGRKRGIVLLNYLGVEIFKRLEKLASKADSAIVLLNSQGYWLKGSVKDDAWGFMFAGKKGCTFDRDYPEEWSIISQGRSGQFFSEHGLFTFQTVYPLHDGQRSSTGAGCKPFAASAVQLSSHDYTWKLVSRVAPAAFSHRAVQAMRIIMPVAVVLFAIMAFLLWLLARAQETRRQAKNALQELNVELECRVEERTKELSGVNRALIVEIDNHKRSQSALKELQIRHEEILNAVGEGIYGLDCEGRIVFVNPAALQMWGYDYDELMGRKIHALIHHTNMLGTPSTEDDCLVCKTIRTGELYRGVETIFWRKDQQSFPAEFTCTPILNDGAVVGSVVTFWDVSKRKLAEEARLLLETAIEQAAESIVITDKNGEIQYVNPFFEQTTGYLKAEVIGLKPGLLKSGEHDAVFYRNMWETLTSGKVWQGQLINRKKDGTLFHEEATLSPVFDGSGNICNYVAVKRDVTKTIELEKMLQQAQKMEAIGTLSAGIAHDFNNVLTAILGYSELARESLSSEESVVRNDLDKVIKAGDRAKEMVKQILTFSRQDEQERKPVKIHAVVQEVLKLLRSSMPSSIEIRYDLQESDAVVLADTTQMHQVLMNLGTNALHAMESGKGVLEIGTAFIDLSAKELEHQPDMSSGRYVRISVKDSGIGMDGETIERIFDPFFTTKVLSKGTGMGLSVVHGIIKNHGGMIKVESVLGKGSTFSLYLPAVDGCSSEPSETRAYLPMGTERILIVDDEVDIVDMVGETFERLGYQIVKTTSSVEAQQIFQQQPDRFDVVITDQTMPVMTGIDLSEELLKIRSDIPVILCSGFHTKELEDKVREKGIRKFIIKPLRIRELATIVREVLDER